MHSQELHGTYKWYVFFTFHFLFPFQIYTKKRVSQKKMNPLIRVIEEKVFDAVVNSLLFPYTHTHSHSMSIQFN